MNILMIGAAGMIGHKLAARIAHDGHLNGKAVSKMVLADMVAPAVPPAGFPITAMAADIANPQTAKTLAALRPDVIFHLAAIVSGEAERNFEKGYAINMDGMRLLLEAIRFDAGSRCPRLVFASSIAVFGTPFPDVIEDDFLLAPLTSYGTQKAIGELLLADYTRKGFVDGIGLRLPTICVRPGKPNAAASGFFSNIIREPLVGQSAVLPVSEEVRHWHASPRSAIGFLLHAAGLEGARIGARRSLSMPGICVSVGEQIAALGRIAGGKAVSLIRREPDPAIMGIVAGWPQNFHPRRALDLGFVAETSFDDIIKAHIEDELGGNILV